MTSFSIWCQRKQNAALSGLFQRSFLTFCRALYVYVEHFKRRHFCNLTDFKWTFVLGSTFMELCRNMKGNSRIPAAPECQNTGMRWDKLQRKEKGSSSNYLWLVWLDTSSATHDGNHVSWHSQLLMSNYWHGLIFIPLEQRCQSKHSLKGCSFKSSCTFCHKCNFR